MTPTTRPYSSLEAFSLRKTMRRITAFAIVVALGAVSCMRSGTDITAGYQARERMCPDVLGGLRYERPCEAQFKTSSLNLKVKADALKKIGAELGISSDKLAAVSDKTINPDPKFRWGRTPVWRG